MKNNMRSSLISASICLLANICSAAIVTSSTTCCNFDNDNCDASGSTWYWSKDKPPTISISGNTGDYMWSNSPSQLQFTKSIAVDDDVTVTFNYYINSQSSTMQLTFYPDTGSAVQISLVSYNDVVAWYTSKETCVECCGGKGPCDGTFVISTGGFGDDFEVAVDNLNIGNQCQSRFECCLFDGNNCGYQDANSLWTFESVLPITTPPPPPVRASPPPLGASPPPLGASPPPLGASPPPPPYPGTDYIYYEPPVTTPTKNSLISPLSTIKNDTIFRGNIYVYTTQITNTLTVSFFNSDKGVTIPLGTISDTDGLFRDFIFDCGAASCCKGVATCSGTIEFDPPTDTGLPAEIYAVDAFEVFGSCGLFPGNHRAYNIHNRRSDSSSTKFT